MNTPKNPYRQLMEGLLSLEDEFHFCRQLFQPKQWKAILYGLNLIFSSLLEASKLEAGILEDGDDKEELHD